MPSDDSFLALSVNNLNMPPHHITRWSDQALRNLTKLLNVELVYSSRVIVGCAFARIPAGYDVANAVLKVSCRNTVA